MDFVRLRIAVAWRAAFNDVADINLIPRKFDGLNDAGQQSTGGAHKRFSALVFLKARPLAHKNQPGAGVALPENDVFPAFKVDGLPELTKNEYSYDEFMKMTKII